MLGAVGIRASVMKACASSTGCAPSPIPPREPLPPETPKPVRDCADARRASVSSRKVKEVISKVAFEEMIEETEKTEATPLN